LGLVRPHARTAQGRAKHGVVDRDNGLQARVLVVAEHDLLMAEGVQGLENHRVLRVGVDCASRFTPTMVDKCLNLLDSPVQPGRSGGCRGGSLMQSFSTATYGSGRRSMRLRSQNDR